MNAKDQTLFATTTAMNTGIAFSWISTKTIQEGVYKQCSQDFYHRYVLA